VENKKMKLIILLNVIILLAFILIGCELLSENLENNKEYRIIYNGNGNESGTVPIDPNSYQTGSFAYIFDNEGNLKIDGFEFNGWIELNSPETSYYKNDTIIISNHDINLYANWVELIYFIVTFNLNNGSEGFNQTILSGTTISEPATPFMEGYEFLGWYDSSSDEKWLFNSIVIEENITLSAKWEKIYNIGDIGPAGGYIFYDDESDSIDDIPGYRYLEVTQEDYPEKLIWGSSSMSYSDDIGIEGASGTALGTGYQNTLDIVSGDDHLDKAADICLDYSVIVEDTIFDDWFLPSKDEMLVMKSNFETIGITTLEGKNYWTSSEMDYNNAWASWDSSSWSSWWGDYPEEFYGLASSYKARTMSIRPVRAF